MIGDSHREYRDDHDGRGPQRVGWEGLGLGHVNPISGAYSWLQVITATMPGHEAIDLLRAEALRPQSDANPRSTSAVLVTILVDGAPVESEFIRTLRGS